MQEKKNNILSIGKVSKLLNISRDTLRYFEQENIVVPKKNAENNYRYYDDWDINFLQGLIPDGPIIGYYLARVQEGKEYKRYLDIFVPIKEESQL